MNSEADVILSNGSNLHEAICVMWYGKLQRLISQEGERERERERAREREREEKNMKGKKQT